MQTTTTLVIAALAMAAVFGSFFLWTLIVSRLSRREPLLATSPRHNVPWRGMHVALAFLLYLVFPSLSAFFIRWKFDISWQEPLPDDNINLLVWGLAAISLLTAISAALVVTYLKIDLAATISDLGWPRQHVMGDIALGLLAFLAIAPPVFALQNFLVQAYERLFDQPGLHPLIELVQENPRADVMLISAISAVLIAPLAEEFLFRVVLQGWLEKVAIRTHQLIERRKAEGSATPDADETTGETERNPYVSPRDADVERSDGSRGPKIVPPLMPGPILLSSVLFASFHVGQGPAPIPLFFLALVLGYLYQKTHRMLPCVALHMTLNAASMVVLWLSVL